MLAIGDKVFVITRRLFDIDLRRHFVGEIQDVSETVIKVQGYAFIFNDFSKEFERRDDIRTRIFTLVDAGIVMTILPAESSIEEIRYIMENNQRFITDGKTFKINVTEFGSNR